jgi:hypothetical protein
MRVSRLDKKQSPVLEAWCIEARENGPDGESPRGERSNQLPPLDDHELQEPRDDDTNREHKPDQAAPAEEPTTGAEQVMQADHTADRSPTHAPTIGSAPSKGMTIVALSTLFWAPMAWLLHWIC